MNNSGVRFGLGPVLTVLLAVGSCAGLASAQQQQWIGGNGNSWDNDLNWLDESPDTNIESALVDLAGPFTIDFESTLTILDYEFTSAGSTLNMLGVTLTTEGTFLHQQAIITGNAGSAIIAQGAATLRGVTFTNLPSFTASSSLLLDGPDDTTISNSTINLTGTTGTWQGAGNLIFGGGAGTSGLSLAPTVTLTIANDQNATWNNTGNRPTVVNAGTLRKNGGLLTSSFTGVELDNTGTVRVSTGTLQFDTVAQITGSTLTGGTWQVDDAATLDLQGFSITTNQATVILNGANSSFGAIALLNTNSATGTFSVQGGRVFTTAGSLTNSGTLDIGAGSRLQVAASGVFTDTGGSITGAGASSVLAIGGDAELAGTTFTNLTVMSMGRTGIGGGLDLAVDNSCIDHNGFGCDWSGPADINFRNGGQFSFGDGATFQINNSQTITWDNSGAQPSIEIQAGASLVRSTTGGGTTSIQGVQLNNAGSVRVETGTLSSDSVGNVVGNTLQGGSWEVRNNATLDFGAQTITTNAATVVLDGANAVFNAISGLNTNDSAGTLDVKNGKTFTTTGNFTNNGVVGVDGTGAPALFKINTGSTLTNYDAATRRITGGEFRVRGSGRASGTVEIDGLDVAVLDSAVTLDGPGASIIDPQAVGDQNALRNLDTIDNAGALEVTNGKNFDTLKGLTVAATGELGVGLDSTFTVNGDLTNFDNTGLFEEGVFDIGGTLRADNAQIVTLANTLVLSGDARIERPDPDSPGNFIDALSTLETVAAAGRLTIRDGHALTLIENTNLFSAAGSVITIGPPIEVPGDTFLHVQGSFTQEGAVFVNGGTLRVRDDYTMRGQLGLSNGGIVEVGGIFTNEGTLSGTGTISLPSGALFVNEGILEPGMSPGTLHIAGGGDLQMGAQSALRMEIAGGVPGEGYDQLLIDGSMLFESLLAGTLEVTLDPAFQPARGQVFELIRFEEGHQGWFAEVLISPEFERILESDRFLVVYIPAPGAAAVGALAGMWAFRRRRPGR